MKNCFLFFLTILVLSCGAKAEDEKTYPSTMEERKDFYSDRLIREFTENGWVVSRNADNSADQIGDSLFFTSLAVASLDCTKAGQLWQSLADDISRNGGFINRFYPLPGEYEGNAESIDGEIGLLFAAVRTKKKCPELAGNIDGVWKQHARYVLDHDNQINPNANVKLVKGLDYPWRIFSFQLDETHEPSYAMRTLFETEMISWAKACVDTRSACFRVHLAMLSILTTKELDRPFKSKNSFCGATQGANIPLVDWYCNRLNADEWLNSFELNKWHYRHQRCGWESPDINDGQKSPAIDWLLFYDISRDSNFAFDKDDVD